MRTTRAVHAENLFNALFCYGDEPFVVFDPATIAASLSTTKGEVERSVAWLKNHYRIAAIYPASGGCYARVTGTTWPRAVEEHFKRRHHRIKPGASAPRRTL